jgi:metal-responsive CopG/Arc/MetJ family transcriptional regulator
MTSDTTQISISMPDEMVNRLSKKAEENGFGNRSNYIRSMIRAGESDISRLDPRTSSSTTEDDSVEIENMILDGLTNEYQDIDDALDSAVKQMAGQLQTMAESESYPVEHDPIEGYRLTED